MRDDTMPGVNSLWFNIEMLLRRQFPGAPIAVLLGVCGGAGRYPAGPIAEFALPSPHVAKRLFERSAIDLVEHDDDPAQQGLRAAFGRGGSAIVAVDSFYLPYRPAYSRVHSGRTLIARATDDPCKVAVTDCWPPAWEGSLDIEQLGQARRSTVPLVPRLEPVFAGVPLDMRWWSLSAAPPVTDREWVRAALGWLHRDERTEGGSAAAIAALADSAAAGPDACRWASLVLRAELSPRVYTSILLRSAARFLADPLLADYAARYTIAIDRIGHARDLLVKQCVRPSPYIERYARDEIRAGAAVLDELPALTAAYETAPAEACHA